jgi:hypothetical protein
MESYNTADLTPSLSSITDEVVHINKPIDELSQKSMPELLKFGVLIFILAILGVNILLYLFEGTDIISKYMSEGIIGIIQSIQNMFSRGLNASKNIVDKSVGGANFYKENKKLNKAINTPKSENIKTQPPAPDMTTESAVQNPKDSQWCYIGKDRTYRSCVKMNRGNKCMSGEIFPTKDICINPTLRHNV